MGTPKAELVFAGRRMIDHLIELLRPLAREIALVGSVINATCDDDATMRVQAGLVYLPDRPGVGGPFAGVAAALSWSAKSDCLIIPCDMPALTPAALNWLIANHCDEAAASVGIRSGNSDPEPLPAVFGSNSTYALDRYIETGKTSLKGFLELLPAREFIIPPSLDGCWINCNTPDDWNQFLGMDAAKH